MVAFQADVPGIATLLLLFKWSHWRIGPSEVYSDTKPALVAITDVRLCQCGTTPRARRPVSMLPRPTIHVCLPLCYTPPPTTKHKQKDKEIENSKLPIKIAASLWTQRVIMNEQFYLICATELVNDGVSLTLWWTPRDCNTSVGLFHYIKISGAAGREHVKAPTMEVPWWVETIRIFSCIVMLRHYIENHLKWFTL